MEVQYIKLHQIATRICSPTLPVVTRLTMCNGTHEPTDFSNAQIRAGHEGLNAKLPPGVLETIKAKIDELSPDLRKLSLSIHSTKRFYPTFRSLTSSASENPELGFEEK